LGVACCAEFPALCAAKGRRRVPFGTNIHESKFIFHSTSSYVFLKITEIITSQQLLAHIDMHISKFDQKIVFFYTTSNESKQSDSVDLSAGSAKCS
jgi:hypothetical protein